MKEIHIRKIWLVLLLLGNLGLWLVPSDIVEQIARDRQTMLGRYSRTQFGWMLGLIPRFHSEKAQLTGNQHDDFRASLIRLFGIQIVQFRYLCLTYRRENGFFSGQLQWSDPVRQDPVRPLR